jgi:hypothetical protein
VLPSWLKGSDPNFTINVFGGQPGALATVSTHLKYFPDFAQLQAEVDRALLPFAQTPSAITVLMARYCETLGAKAA